MQNLAKILRKKFKGFVTDPRWDYHPIIQRFHLKGFIPTTKPNGIMLCMSHATIAFRLVHATTKQNSVHIVYCGLGEYRARDCAEGMIWEEETGSSACDALELYSEHQHNFLTVSKTPFKAAILQVSKMHAQFDSMTVAVSSIGLNLI